MSKNNPLISIVMPAYNCEQFIDISIQSILNQTYTNWELLIADDASKDKTKNIIDNYTDPRIKKFHNKSNLGYLKTCNKLFALTTGEYIAFQDADDLSDPSRLEIQLNYLTENNLKICGTNLIGIDIEGNELYCSNYPENHDLIVDSIFSSSYHFIPNSFLFHKSIYEEIGGYNDFFDRIGAEDYYWTLLISEKFKISNIKFTLYYYRYNQNSVTGDWSDNLKKMATAKILNFLINQRKIENSDYLETKKKELLNNKMDELLHPYYVDKSLFYRELSIKYFYENQKKRALSLACRALIKNPLKTENIKNLIYFLRKWH
jgi:glycosyltransferase involved in cell wall biosynthesis